MGNILQAIKLQMEPLRSLAFGDISGTYTAIGDPFAFTVRLLLVQNMTDVLMTFSLDGVNDNLVLPTNGFLLIDVTSNRALSYGFFIAAGTTIYVSTAGSPSTGSVYVTTVYANE